MNYRNFKKEIAYVYHLIDKIKQEVFYVGISSFIYDVEDPVLKYRRAYSHLEDVTKNNLRTWRKIKKLNFDKGVEIKIIKENITPQEAFEIEKSEIKKYGRKGIEKNGILFNFNEGGEGITSSDVSRNCLRSKKHRKSSSERITKYNRSLEHRQQTALLNSLYPKVSSKESRKKLSESQKATWNKKTPEEKRQNTLNRSIGRAWNVLKRIEGNIINEEIYANHRSKGSRLANTEPSWKTITNKAGGVMEFLRLVKQNHGKEFVYENKKD